MKFSRIMGNGGRRMNKKRNLKSVIGEIPQMQQKCLQSFEGFDQIFGKKEAPSLWTNKTMQLFLHQ
jgi:hypothetical protein